MFTGTNTKIEIDCGDGFNSLAQAAEKATHSFNSIKIQGSLQVDSWKTYHYRKTKSKQPRRVRVLTTIWESNQCNH